MASIPRPASHPLLDAALDYAARGIPVFPLIPRAKKPVVPKNEGGEGFKDATCDPEQIRSWWKRWRQANIGIACGDTFTRDDGTTRPAANWCVIDIDTKNGATYDDLAAMGKLPHTLMAQTPSGGLHLVFRYPRSGVRIDSDNRGKVARGIDVRAYGGYIAAAPSVTPNGQYEWVNDLEPAPLPSWLLKLLTDKPEPTPIRKPAAPVDADESDRDAYWLAWALQQVRPGTSDTTGYKLAQQLLTDPQVRDVDGTLATYARQATLDTSDPFDERDIDRWLKSAQQSSIVRRGEPAKRKRTTSAPATAARTAAQPQDEAARPLPAERPALRALPPVPPADDEGPEAELPVERKKYHRTEMGNAERLLDSYGDRLRYTKATGYVAWDGRRWKAGAELQAETWAKAVIRDIYREAADLASEAAQAGEDGERDHLAGEAQELMKWAMSSEKAKMVNAMLMLARSACAVDITRFDNEPWMFNCDNGTVDLHSGELRPHRKNDHLMQITSVAYNPAAQCPTWERVVREVMLDDMEMVAYLQRVIGRALTGDVSEQEWYLMVGEGENGKSVVMETLARVMGEYAHMMAPESITMTGQPRKGHEASPDIAMLKGKRFVRVTETQEGARIDAARVKSLSGGDEQTARFLNKDLFTFRPTATIFIYTNHRPETRETTHAYWRRVRYVPFDLNLREHPERKDEHLMEKLLAELPGILAWCVQGCLAWQREGLKPPKRVLEATEAYRADSDVLKDFIETHCLVRGDYEVRASALYAKYVEWCKETGERQQNMRRFGKAITERGFERKTSNGVVYVGIGLRGEYEQETLTI